MVYAAKKFINDPSGSSSSSPFSLSLLFDCSCILLLGGVVYFFSDDDARELLTYVIIPDCVTVCDIFFALLVYCSWNPSLGPNFVRDRRNAASSIVNRHCVVSLHGQSILIFHGLGYSFPYNRSRELHFLEIEVAVSQYWFWFCRCCD